MARYTKEEIEDSYEFKVVRRVLKKENPWIKGMVLSPTWEEYKSLLFVDLIINPFEYLKTIDIELPDGENPYRDYYYTNGVPYLSMYIPYRFKKSELASDKEKEIKRTILRVQQSPAIPTEMKLPRELAISSWIATN